MRETRGAVAPRGVPQRVRIAVEHEAAGIAALLAVGAKDARAEFFHRRQVAKQSPHLRDLQRRGRSEAVTGGVGQQAGAELAGGGALRQVAVEVDGADEQSALADACFEDEAELAARVPVVDDLHDRAQRPGQGIEHHGFGLVMQVLPLPVAVERRGELGQGGVLGIEQ